MQTSLTSVSVKEPLRLAVGVLVALLWLACPSSARAQQAEAPQGEALTLQSTVRKMLRQNGEFLAEKYQQKANGFGTISAISELLPTASVRYDNSLIYRKYEITREGVNGPETTPYSEPDTSLNITVSQPLYSRRFYTVAERLADYKSSKYLLQARANDFILETVQAYLEVQIASEQRRYAEKNLEDIRRLFNRVRARARVDSGQRYLLNRAQTRLSLGEEDLSKTRQLEAARRSKLSRLIGQGFGRLEAVPTLKVEELPESAEDSLVRAREKNPNLLAARAEVKRSRSAAAGGWGALVPEISLDFNYRNSKNQSGVRAGDEVNSTGDIVDISLGIGVVYEFRAGLTPVFDALAGQQRLRAARYLRNDAERRIEEEVNNAWVEVAENRRIHAQALQFLKATEREKNAYRRQFRAGQRNLLDLLNIQNEFFAAQQRELGARVSKEVARYKILATVGDLVERFGGIKG